MNISTSTIGAGAPGEFLSDDAVREIVARALPAAELRGKKVLLIVPDATRSGPVGLLFQSIFATIGRETKALDVMIALGTHQPMSEDAINARLEITTQERSSKYSSVNIFNHAWDDPGELVDVGEIPASEIA